MKRIVAFLAVLGVILVAIVAIKQRQGESIEVKEKLVSVPEDLKKAVSS